MKVVVDIQPGQLTVLIAYSAMRKQEVDELVQASIDLLIDQIVYDDWTRIRELVCTCALRGICKWCRAYTDPSEGQNF